MPSVAGASARGLARDLLQSFEAVPAPAMARRDILVDAADRVYDVKTAFSSWDKCMDAAFCKWPVIAIIVVGSLILLSIVWCIVRRVFCGLACCCSFFQCLKCCGNCCGCCDAPGPKKHKYLDEPYIPPNHGYQAQPPMHAHQTSHNPPQYAEFDMVRKGGEDSLPEMPSWESGASKKVELDDQVEMAHLNQPSTAATPPAGPLAAGAVSPLGPPGASPTSYMSGPQTRNGYGQLPQAISRQNTGLSSIMDHRGYHDYSSSPDPNGYGYEQPYAGYAAPGPAPYGRQTSQAFAPDPVYPAYHDQHQSFAGAPAGYGMRRQGTGDSAGVMGARTLYGTDPRSRASPSPRQTPRPRGEYQYTQSPRATPAPRESPYGKPSYGPADYGGAHYSPPSGWTSQGNVPEPDPPQSPITNNAGFDFTSGYSRPQTQSYHDHRPSESAKPSAQEAYPGYKPYQPAS